MFARAAFARTSLRFPPPVARRAYSAPANEPKKSNVLIYSAIAGAAAGAGYYYYYTTAGGAGVKAALGPAEITLKGDGEWVDLRLKEVTPVTHNTKRFRFELPSENHVSGLKVASALLTKYKGPNDAKPTIRPYTPINPEDARGYLDLLVKRYEKGPMSTHLHAMTPNQTLSFKGPLPKYEWTPNKHEHISLIAGGTGITPMYQLMRAIFSNPEDRTKVTLVFGNLTEEDILLRRELVELENTYPQRFKVFYVLDNAPKGSSWATQGRVTKELLKTVLPEPGSGNNKIFVCGPPGMYKAVSGVKKSPSDQGEVGGVLKELGYKKEDVYKF
ncbi:ferredoxin reductase-like protein [Choiromyces venosus 120613-1]|uniref:NADH-cytochrome b5 reductase 2 n=1 Tax=Choiromyces venosus 120613-1 TaxID=1336337 RepID=A0A3N4K1J3_9PEZI|nr:ferredoxin reductase-like protein [Choiromyces venosus 120613-1]